MRSIVLTLVLAIAIVGAQGYAGLNAEQRDNLHNTNLHHIGNLDQLARNCLEQLLNALEVRQTYIRLGNAIKDGHSVMYEFLEGQSPSLVKELAPKYKLQVKSSKSCKCNDCCGRILLPGGDVVEAVVVPGKRQERAGLPPSLDPTQANTTGNAPESPSVQSLENKKRAKFGLTDEQRQWYYDNNVAQVTKMDAKAQLFLKKLLDDLREHEPKLVLQFMAPVPNGHAVRFDLVRGDLSKIGKWASKCGVRVEENTIIAPEKDVIIKNAENNAEAVDGHLEVEHPEQSDSGAPEPVNVVPTAQRNVVKELPDKWIKPTISLVEVSDDADALASNEAEPAASAASEEPAAAAGDDDDDAFLAEYFF